MIRVKEPPKPITADITSKASRLRSMPLLANMPSIPKIWNTTLIRIRMAALAGEEGQVSHCTLGEEGQVSHCTLCNSISDCLMAQLTVMRPTQK
ncbi:MAG: hypothetical protein ABW166_02050 [Sedimenticola sp.]